MESNLDLRTPITAQNGFKTAGVAPMAVMSQEDNALRITWNSKNRRTAPVGVSSIHILQGDFDITASYALLDAEPPEKGYGTGARLWISLADGGTVSLGRVNLPNKKGHAHVAYYVKKVSDGKNKIRNKFEPTQAKAGSLRLVRNDNMLSYLIAEYDSDDFAEIFRAEIGTQDVTGLTFTATTGGDKCGVDLRLTRLRIRADKLSTERSSAGGFWTYVFWISLPIGCIIVVGSVVYVLGKKFLPRFRTVTTEGVATGASAGQTVENNMPRHDAVMQVEQPVPVHSEAPSRIDS
jgi:hypothetical protein